MSTGSNRYVWSDAASTPLVVLGGDVLVNDETIWEIIRKEKYDLYVMYLPPGPTSGPDVSQWVPTKMMTWNFAFDLKDGKKNTVWAPQGTLTQPNGTAWVAANSEPAWEQTYNSGKWVETVR
jgi:hypothetical protein